MVRYGNTLKRFQIFEPLQVSKSHSNISSRFSNNYEVNASELLENHK